ncbi:MAG TPA: alanine racemase [Stellaceae bacterium]|nr:alanine racemase [Stellaceae bacterium]
MAVAPDSILEIDLDAIAANWRRLRARLRRGAECAAVVKADAYGLGAAQVGPRLWRAGCRLFFVADVGEGVALRRLLPEARVAILNGFEAGQAREFARARLIPVLNRLGEITAWQKTARGAPAMIHLDTGMARLGLPPAEAKRLAREPGLLAGVTVAAWISHLSSAGNPAAKVNRTQLDAFRALLKSLPLAPASLAAGSGIFLGPAYHFDFVRPGAALYGVNPLPGHLNPMRQVARLKAKILQTRDLDRGQAVGYDGIFRMKHAGRVATVGIGYADGWLRSASNRASVGVGGRRAPVIGRISMDLFCIDVTGIDPKQVFPGAYVDLLDDSYGVDDFARDAGTIGYEVLTQLGDKHHRVYRGRRHA